MIIGQTFVNINFRIDLVCVSIELKVSEAITASNKQFSCKRLDPTFFIS